MAKDSHLTIIRSREEKQKLHKTWFLQKWAWNIWKENQGVCYWIDTNSLRKLELTQSRVEGNWEIVWG